MSRVFGHVIQRDAAISIQRDDHHRATPRRRKVTYSTSTLWAKRSGQPVPPLVFPLRPPCQPPCRPPRLRARSLRFMIDRRRVLQLGALAALTTTVLPACGTDEQDSRHRSPPRSPAGRRTGPDRRLRRGAAIGRSPRTVVYQRLRDEHVERGSRSAGSNPTPRRSMPTSVAGPDPRRAPSLRIRSDAAATSPDVEQAQILALIAASEAQHVVDLEAL